MGLSTGPACRESSSLGRLREDRTPWALGQVDVPRWGLPSLSNQPHSSMPQRVEPSEGLGAVSPSVSSQAEARGFVQPALGSSDGLGAGRSGTRAHPLRRPGQLHYGS